MTRRGRRPIKGTAMILRFLVILLTFAATAFATDTEAAGRAPQTAPSAHGHLVLIGGGEKPDAAMTKFVELAGGTDAPIVVIPTASKEPDTPQYYDALFRKDHGCEDVTVMPIRNRADADRPDLVVAAKRARGIFFGGGDQALILRALAGSAVLEALRDAFAGGAVVGGTSAGTACQSELMITGEGNFRVIASRSVELWDGLGFLPAHVVVDQHFIARQRQNRLISVILEQPDKLGIGVDEDTAIWVKPDDTFEVIGLRSVMVFDATGARMQRSGRETKQDLLGVHGMQMHILLPGEAYDLRTRRVIE
ncbi:MAG: cyanophycinase [Thermoanaerobaculia bacterium]